MFLPLRHAAGHELVFIRGDTDNHRSIARRGRGDHFRPLEMIEIELPDVCQLGRDIADQRDAFFRSQPFKAIVKIAVLAYRRLTDPTAAGRFTQAAGLGVRLLDVLDLCIGQLRWHGKTSSASRRA